MDNTQSQPLSAESSQPVVSDEPGEADDSATAEVGEANASEPSLPEDTDRPRRPSPPVDLDLVRRAREGDTSAFEAIFRAWQRRIYNLVLQMVNNEADATDLTQDVFVKLYESLPTLRLDEAFVSFLYRMAINLCRDHYRRRGRVIIDSIDQPRPGGDEDAPAFEIPDASGDPHRALEMEELQARVKAAVATLSEDHKTVIVLHHFQDMELTDIAGVMGCKVGTVKSRLARAREELKRKLGSYMTV